MRPISLVLVTLVPCWLSPAFANEAPVTSPSAADLLREASPSERETIENVLKRLHPEEHVAINALVEQVKDEEKARVGEQKFVEGWSGQIAVGANWSSGNSDEWSVSGSLDLKRKGPRWEHKFEGEIDLSDSEGERTAERYSAGYRARRDFGKSPIFAFGSLRYEYDRFQGIDRRFTEALGAGYQIFDRDELEWEVSAGPAMRQTRFEDGSEDDRLALFLGSEFRYDITDKLTLRQDSQAVFDSDNGSFSSTTSLSSNLYGKLSGKFSFTVDVETDPPPGNKKTDTYTRVSIVLEM